MFNSSLSNQLLISEERDRPQSMLPNLDDKKDDSYGPIQLQNTLINQSYALDAEDNKVEVVTPFTLSNYSAMEIVVVQGGLAKESSPDDRVL